MSKKDEYEGQAIVWGMYFIFGVFFAVLAILVTIVPWVIGMAAMPEIVSEILHSWGE